MIKTIIISTPFSEARGPGLLALIRFCRDLLNRIRHGDRGRDWGDLQGGGAYLCADLGISGTYHVIMLTTWLYGADFVRPHRTFT